MNSSLAKPLDFTVHVFVDHGPFIASILLPDLFSDFPDSAWKLSQLIATPRRPAEISQQSQMSHNLFRELNADPRKGLGRYVLPDPVPNSTTLRELSEMLEQEFGMTRNLLAHFTIFPQWPWDGDIEPEWNDRPLPWDLTLGEAALLDLFALDTGPYVEISDQYAPVLYLVIEAKAAGLKRIVGRGFLASALGEEYKYRRDIWNKLESFTGAYPCSSRPKLVNELLPWRGASYSLKYIDNERAKLAIQQPLNQKAKIAISTLTSQWENWVLKQNYGNDNDIKILQDYEVEGKVRSILRHRGTVKEWGESDKEECLVEMLLKPAANNRTGLKIQERLQLERRRAKAENPEGPREMASKEDASEQPVNQARPNNPVEAISFRREDGTLDLALSTFSIKSGILSWGQMLPIYYGSLQQNLTNNAARTPDKLSGGTIIQNVYTYKSAARNGEWKVRRYYSTWLAEDYYDSDGRETHAGWVVCHSDFNAMEVVKRVRAIRGTGPGAVSNRNEHVDKDFLYIGRYDWSYHWHHPTDRDFEAKFNDWAGLSVDISEKAKILTPEQQIMEDKQKTIIDLRHKLLANLLMIGPPLKEGGIPAMVDYIGRLEQHAGLEAHIIHQTKIHKVLKRVLKDEDILREDEFDIKRRLAVLVYKWTETLSTEPELATVEVPASETDSGTDQPVLDVRRSGYFITMDALDFDPDFAQAYKRSCDGDHEIPAEVVFRKGGTRFGAFVDITRVEYEFVKISLYAL